MKIDEKNILIAEFYGYKYYPKTKWYQIFTKWSNCWVLNYNDYIGITKKGFLFDRSWNHLIPIVEKIESIYDDFHGYFGVHIYSNSCTIQGTKLNTGFENPHYAYFNDVVLSTKLESTYEAVVSWIIWYNKNLKK